MYMLYVNWMVNLFIVVLFECGVFLMVFCEIFNYLDVVVFVVVWVVVLSVFEMV